MDSRQTNHSKPPSNPPQLQPQNPFNKTLSEVQHNCSKVFQNLTSSFHHHLSHFNPPNLPSFKSHLDVAISNFQKNALQAISSTSSSAINPVWARITPPDVGDSRIEPAKRPVNHSLSDEAIAERLAGVPVYALSNSEEEFVFLSGVQSGKSLGLFCLRKEDADDLLNEMRTMDPGMRKGSKTVAVALNKVFKLRIHGVAFRLVPEASQIKHALKELKKSDPEEEGFTGVPVFQSRSLVLKSQGKTYRPVFFRKEDLVSSLKVASEQQSRLNPARRQDDIEVGVLEEMILAMKGNRKSKWDDVVFIPPGFDVSTDPSQQAVTGSD